MTRNSDLRLKGRARRRRSVGGSFSLRQVSPAPAKLVRASRQTYFALYAPRVSLKGLKSKAYHQANRPKFLAAVLLIIFALSLYEIFASDIFYVPNLALEGIHILPQGEVDQAAGIQGWNVFFVNDRDVAAAIKRLPEVKDVQVSTEMPNRVAVRINERSPRFAWVTKGSTYWVDDDGIAVRARFVAPSLLTLKDVDGTAVEIGERVSAEAFNAAVSLRNLWPKGPTAFEWSKAHGLAARDEHGWLIYFGSASQMADKLAALKIVTAQLAKDRHTIAYIDVGNGLPYYQEVATKN